MTDPSPERNRLRERALRARRAVDDNDQAAASMAVLTRLARYGIVRHADTVAGYRAIRGEVDIDAALELLRSEGATITTPRIRGNDLEFVSFRLDDPTMEGPFGIREPIGFNTTPIAEHDIVLLPLVGFDRSGNRLGWGRGYYDRALASVANTDDCPLLVGIAHAIQEFPLVPSHPGDVPLDAVVTEEEVIAISPRSKQKS